MDTCTLEFGPYSVDSTFAFHIASSVVVQGNVAHMPAATALRLTIPAIIDDQNADSALGQVNEVCEDITIDKPLALTAGSVCELSPDTCGLYTIGSLAIFVARTSQVLGGLTSASSLARRLSPSSCMAQAVILESSHCHCTPMIMVAQGKLLPDCTSCLPTKTSQRGLASLRWSRHTMQRHAHCAR